MVKNRVGATGELHEMLHEIIVYVRFKDEHLFQTFQVMKPFHSIPASDAGPV
jgi:hypothetical protein